jgi:MFS family permease
MQHPDSRYPWVIVAAGGFMGCVAIGSIFSLPVFLQPMSAATGWSRADISLAMTFNFIVMGLASFGWGMVLDRFGPHAVLLPGSSLLGLGLVLASRASSVEEFQLVFGVLVGAGGGAIFAPLMATVTGWFDQHRSLGGLAGLGRHGRDADDGRPHRRGTCIEPRLALCPAIDWCGRLGAVAAGYLPGAAGTRQVV